MSTTDPTYDNRELAWSSPATQRRKAARELSERVIEFFLFIAAASSVIITFGILEILVSDTWKFFAKEIERDGATITVPVMEFLTGTEWTVLFENPKFGILSLVLATFVTTGVALLVAIPVGTILAVYLSEFADSRLREFVKPVLEVLAGIPTVVYGYFALEFVTPILSWLILHGQKLVMPGRQDFDYYTLPSFNMLSAGIVMGISIIPFISSISEDAMRAVPNTMREGSYAMGATRLQTSLNVVIPASVSGIVAAYILGISRAIGQTMIVAIAAGLQPRFSINPLDDAATISAYIVQVAQGDIEFESIQYLSIFAAGLVLVLLTLFLNIVGFFLTKRFRETY